MQLIERDEYIKKLITEKNSKIGKGIITVIFLFGASYYALLNNLPGSCFCFLIAGLVSLFVAYGKEGIKKIFVPIKGRHKIRTIFKFYLLSIITSCIAVLILKPITELNSNPIMDGFNYIELIKTIPALMGEELFTVCILLFTGAAVYRKTDNQKHAIIIGVVVSTILFAALHILTYNSVAQALIGIGLVRIPFTLAILKEDSIRGGFYVHIAYDWTMFIFNLL